MKVVTPKLGSVGSGHTYGHACTTYAGSAGLSQGWPQVQEIGGLGVGYAARCRCNAPLLPLAPVFPSKGRTRAGA